jgi:DNA-binding response OmpR family regulator
MQRDHAGAPREPETAPERTILVVEDDVALGRQLVTALRKAGFAVELATDLLQAETVLTRTRATERPVLVVLDLSLPSGSGVELLERFAERGLPPVLVLTARTDLQVRLRCFALGAVDYVAKPFFLEELLARIAVRLGETRPAAGKTVVWGDLSAELEGRTLRRAGEIVALTRTETAVLFCLIRRPGAAVSRDWLATHALEGEDDTGPRAVDSHVARLRRKLGAEGAAIHTVWGIGYRFELTSQPKPPGANEGGGEAP